MQKAEDIKCPTCEADPGDWCVLISGVESLLSHLARREALRERQEREAVNKDMFVYDFYCPTCCADPGERCRSKHHGDVTNAHLNRKRKAVEWKRKHGGVI
jgi:hypothetical protein